MKATTSRSLAWLLFAAPLCLSACGGVGESGEDLGSIELPLPAGSNATVVSNTIPLTMNPGERVYVNAVMKNTGASSPTNDWNSTYSLSRVSTSWSWVSTAVTGTVTPNNNASFGFVITAPAVAGTYPFTARMKQDVQFGSTLSVPSVVVSTATPRQWSCTYVPGSSTVPTTMTPGESRVVTVTVKNSGTQTWSSSGFYLKSTDSPAGLWGSTSYPLTTSIAPNANASFSVLLKAPTTAGTYSLKRQMTDNNVTGIGTFDAVSNCLDTSITVGGSAALNASVVSQDFPTTMAPGETRLVSVSMKNTGTQTWAADGNYGLYSQNSPVSLWATTRSLVTAATAQNANASFSLVITAPSTPGSYNHMWQMRKTSGVDASFYGALINVPVTVDPNAQAQYGATVASQNIPLKVTAGKTYTFQVGMTNSGSAAWSGSSFTLYSTNSPASLWTTTNVPLGASETVASAATRTFNISAKAPAAAGTYESRWRMRYLSGIGFFGEEAVTSGIVVTLCGNSTTDAGETCDDGNLVDGDGCSSDCATETTVTTDLAVAAAGRTLIGSQNSRQLSTVAIGDVTNDAVSDVVVGENATFVVGGVTRTGAGVVYGYSGGASFLNGTSTSVSSGPAFKIYGAESGDGLGTLATGSIVIGDVTGDAVPDLILAASGADGASNMRSAAGEVYVIKGAATVTGTIDLAAAPSQLTATIIGAHASDSLNVLGVGDLTGDGINDLILGAPVDSTNGTNAGAIYVVTGGAGITGTIDLLAPSVATYKILGAAANDLIGFAADVGDIGGSSANDIVIGAANSSPSGRTKAGAAWAVFGPLTGNVNLATAVGAAGGPNVKWLGAGDNDKLGGSVAVGNVAGSTRKDVLIGAVQQRKGGLQFGAVNIWAGPLTSGTTYDLNGAAGQTAIILGRDQYDDLSSSMRVADWTGDGYLDIAAAAHTGDGPANDRDGAGEVTVVRGSSTLSGTIDLAAYSPLFIAYGAISRDLIGPRQTTLAFGNVNGDGKADLCIGSAKGGTGGSLVAPGRVDCFAAP